MKIAETKFSQRELEEVYATMKGMSNDDIDATVKLFINLAWDEPTMFRQLKRAAEKMKIENKRERVKCILRNYRK